METFPEELRQRGRFCCWRYEDRNGGRTKVPYDPRTGQPARSNDLSSFVSYEQAVRAKGYDGIGIGIFGSICAIDLDDCISETGQYSQAASDIVSLMHSYTELSPSGRGLHILFRADSFRYDTDRYYIMNHKAGIEVYVAGATNKYVTVTGKRPEKADYAFGERSKELGILLETYMRRPGTLSGVNGENAVNAANMSEQDRYLLSQAIRKPQFRQLWTGSVSGYRSQSEADLALCSHLAFWTGKDPKRMDELFRKSKLMRPKWDERHGRDTYGALTIRKAIEGCSNIYQPPKGNRFQPLRPLKQENNDLPLFPTDCLPAVIRDYVKAVAAHSQTSEDMAAVIGVGVLAVCLQGKFMVQGTPGYDEPLSLYTVVIAPPGERKSSVMRDMTRDLYDYEKDFNEMKAPEIRENRQKRESLERRIEGLRERLCRADDEKAEKELHDLEGELEELPDLKTVRFFADDCSSEALTSLLANNGGLFSVISTEGGIFDIMAGRYSGKANFDVWLKGHCGDAIRVDRMGREPEYISNPSLSAILSIQPSVLDEIMSNTTMTGRGLIARFLYAFPPSRIGSRIFCAPPIPESVGNAYRDMIYHLMSIPKPEEVKEVTLSEGATEIISKYFAKHEAFLAGEGQIISDWAAKYIGAVLRIAGLLHVAEHGENDPEIPEEVMKRAILIGSYFLAHSSYAYSMMGNDLSIKKALFVLGRIKRERITLIKRWELAKLCRGKFFKDSDGIQSTLELLESYGYIRIETAPEEQRPGRKSDMLIRVNPEVYSGEGAHD